MPVLATPVGNQYSHIAYLVWCAETGEATAIDPYHVDLMLETARTKGLRITRIVNTHEHWDHAGRNEAMRRETRAEINAPRAAAGVIEQLDRMLGEGDTVAVGSSVTLRVVETPGHTMTHIGLLGAEADGPFLLCGDTLFGAGVGNCGYGGHAPTLFDTVERLRTELDPATRLYPGHDYLARNLAFTLHHVPDNAAAAAMLPAAEAGTRFTTLAEEAEINLFLRLDDPALRASLGQEKASRLDTFLALRRARDSW